MRRGRSKLLPLTLTLSPCRRGMGRGNLRINREAPAKRNRFRFHSGFDFGVASLAVGCQAVDYLRHQAADMLELGDTEATRGARRRADADAGRDRRLLRVERHRVLVDGDVRAPQRLLDDIAGELLGSQV